MPTAFTILAYQKLICSKQGFDLMIYYSIIMRNVHGVLSFLFSAFITTATQMIRTIIRVHLVSVIIAVCSVRRIVGIHLIRVVIELTSRMSIPGNTMSFCH